jgi:hypothetical protein
MKRLTIIQVWCHGTVEPFLDFAYSRILTFYYHDDDSDGGQYLDGCLQLLFLSFNRLPEDGTEVPKHAGADADHEIYCMIFILFYVIKFICWLVY